MCNRTRMTAVASVLFALVLVLVGCNGGDETAARNRDNGDRPDEQKEMDIVATAREAGSFDTLVKAIEAAGLEDTLKGEGPFTVFAPTDDAFAKLPAEIRQDLLRPENRDMLREILTYHVLPSRASSKDVAQLSSAGTVEGGTLSIRQQDGDVMVGSAKVVQTDIQADNGVIHVIDTVLLPRPALAYVPARLDLIDALKAGGSHKTLLKAIDAAGLTETLRGKGPFTLIAPTDAAFDKVPSDTLNNLLDQANRDQLTAVLTFHVIAGRHKAADLADKDSVKTLQGQSLSISGSAGGLTIGGAKVTLGDIQASNGVIHSVGQVLMPDLSSMIEDAADEASDLMDDDESMDADDAADMADGAMQGAAGDSGS